MCLVSEFQRKTPWPLSALKSQSHSSGRWPSLELPSTSIACNGNKCTPSQEGVKRDERPFYVTQIVIVNYFEVAFSLQAIQRQRELWQSYHDASLCESCQCLLIESCESHYTFKYLIIFIPDFHVSCSENSESYMVFNLKEFFGLWLVVP